jgi:hypothetical protein
MNSVVKWYIIGLSLYHILTGCISYFTPAFALKFYRSVYGCQPIEQRHLRIILRPWGALAVFAGIAGLAAVNGSPNQPTLLAGLALLLTLRIGYRVALWRELQEISGIEPRRNWFNIGLLGAGVLLLLWGAWTSLQSQ